MLQSIMGIIQMSPLIIRVAVDLADFSMQVSSLIFGDAFSVLPFESPSLVTSPPQAIDPQVSSSSDISTAILSPSSSSYDLLTDVSPCG